MSDKKELRRLLEGLRARHDSSDLSFAHDCLFTDLIAAVEILARHAHFDRTPESAAAVPVGHRDPLTDPLTDPQKPTKPAVPLCACKRPPDRHIQTVKGDGWLDCDGLVRLYR